MRDFEETGVSAFHFNASAVKRALDKFVVPYMMEKFGRQFYSQLQVTRTIRILSLVLFHLLLKLPKSYRNKIFQRRLRDSGFVPVN